MMWKLFNWCFEWFQRRCPHDPSYVSADILQGDFQDSVEVKYCQRCGAYQVNYKASIVGHGMIHEPRATWVDKPRHPISWKQWQANWSEAGKLRNAL